MTETDRLTAIEARAQAVSGSDWRQRAADAGFIEDSDGRPIAVLGTSGDVRLPVGEFLSHAPRDVQWLIQQIKQMRAALDELWDRLDNAGSLISTSYVQEAIESTLPDAARIREWARANGYDLGDEDLIPKLARLAYRRAHNGTQSAATSS